MKITADVLKNYVGRHVKVTFSNNFTTEGVLELVTAPGEHDEHFLVNHWNFKPSHVKEMQIA